MFKQTLFSSISFHNGKLKVSLDPTVGEPLQVSVGETQPLLPKEAGVEPKEGLFPSYHGQSSKREAFWGKVGEIVVDVCFFKGRKTLEQLGKGVSEEIRDHIYAQQGYQKM